VALENPHCGVSGVPFMNKTTGALDTALSIAERVSCDSHLAAMGANRRVRRVRVVWRNAWVLLVSWRGDKGREICTDANKGLAIMFAGL
jgi:hypothetical protein